MKTAYSLTATFPRKPPRFLHPGIILFPNSPAHLLVSWRILIWNLETREEEIRKAEAGAAFDRKRNCIQPSKPTDRLYNSQAADGLAFLHYFA